MPRSFLSKLKNATWATLWARTKVLTAKAIQEEAFIPAMEYLSYLRGPVDAFFDKVTVNADDPALRLNRLRLLSALRDAVHRVADFSKIAG